jgi:flagellin
VNSAGTGVTLTNATGNDISLSDTTVTNGGNVLITKLNSAGTASGAAVTLTGDATAEDSTTTGFLTLDSSKSFGIVATTTDIIASSTSTLNKVSDLDVSDVTKATAAIKTVDAALGFISGERAKYGALQSRFESTITNLQTSAENLSASRSRVQDADFAIETANLSRAQILQQAGTAMVAQANQLPQGVLALLR